MSKHEWRKKEKKIYLPKTTPEIINIPEFSYAVIVGEGNPSSELFKECVGVLYSVSYAIKMNSKKLAPMLSGYQDYTVYPLEGIWDLIEGAQLDKDGKFNKDDLAFKLMIRQPDFVDQKLFAEMVGGLLRCHPRWNALPRRT